MASDRVSELYRGEIWDRKSRQVCRDRIHWMCAQATGQRVLDVGCSQGIASLLLGQEGHQVVGVDIDPAAIEFAQRELDAYPDPVKENVEFRLVAPHELPFEDGSFDTVLLGEVIEHLNRPELMLAEIRRLLKPGGTVVITTPFGVHSDPGHVRTFYLNGLLRTVEDFFRTRQLQVVDKYICYTGVAEDRSADGDDEGVPVARLLQLSEEAFRSAELVYCERLDAHEAKCAQHRADLEDNRKRLSQLSKRARLAEAWHAGCVQFVREFRTMLADDKSGVDLKRLLERVRQIEAKIGAGPETAHQLEILGQVVQDFRVQLEASKRALEQQRRDALARADRERQEAVQRERAAAAQRLEEEKRRLRAAQEKLSVELDKARKAGSKAEQQLRALQARVSRQAELIEYSTAELNLKQQEVRYQLGDALVRGATSPIDFVKLPKRFVSLYFEGLRRRRERKRSEVQRERGPASPAAAVPSTEAPRPSAGPVLNWYGVLAAGPNDSVDVVARHHRLRDDFARFADHVVESGATHVVVMFGGTTYIQNVRGNRPIRMTRALQRMNVPVLFNFHRGRETDHIPPYAGGLVFQSPIDRTTEFVEELVSRDLGRTRGVFVASYPHSAVCRLVNLANANGWATIYDCRDDWEEFHKVGMAKWYKPAAERFVLNNCDMTCCVARPLREKLKRLSGTRPVRLSPNAYDPAFVDTRYRRHPGTQVKIGYFGHLSESWFDWDSLRWIARQRPDYAFEIIGHSAPKNNELPQNVVLLGPKTPPEICGLAAEWHVGIITFRMGSLADAVDPIKIYEYFGLGLPVV
ncbi:MAG: methyltransferase domain-containing protein, partial [Planctomycetes bacterium]|nr:methyltransferase domain-containing protein [Planctomycetota bacterium]